MKGPVKKNQSGHLLKRSGLHPSTGVIMMPIIHLYTGPSSFVSGDSWKRDGESTCRIDWFCYSPTQQTETSFSLMSAGLKSQSERFRQQTHLCNLFINGTHLCFHQPYLMMMISQVEHRRLQETQPFFFRTSLPHMHIFLSSTKINTDKSFAVTSYLNDLAIFLEN